MAVDHLHLASGACPRRRWLVGPISARRVHEPALTLRRLCPLAVLCSVSLSGVHCASRNLHLPTPVHNIRGRSADAESPGCFTMTDIYNWRGTVSSGGVLSSKGPIFQLDDDGAVMETVGAIGEPVSNKWLLTAELYVTSGAIFYCKGTDVGGDCDALRIQSTGPTDWYEVRGHGGSLYFENTIVTSWDTPNRIPQVSWGSASFKGLCGVYRSELQRPPRLDSFASGGGGVGAKTCAGRDQVLLFLACAPLLNGQGLDLNFRRTAAPSTLWSCSGPRTKWCDRRVCRLSISPREGLLP